MRTVKVAIDKNMGFYPTRGTPGSAGWDLSCPDDVVLTPNLPIRIDMKVRVQIPSEYVGIINPRSSMGARGIILVTNTVDSDYRGNLFVCIMNLQSEPYHIRTGERIAQLVILRMLHLPLERVMNLENETVRGTGSFGSTGK